MFRIGSREGFGFRDGGREGGREGRSFGGVEVGWKRAGDRATAA